MSNEMFVPPASPTIQIPDTGNEAMQRFFHDIVDQLQTISTKTSPVLSFPSPALSDRSSFASTTYTQSPSDVDDVTQFEDAEEDSHARNSPAASSIRSPVLPEMKPQSVLNSPIVSGRLSLRNPPRTAAAARPGPRPNSAFAAASAPVVAKTNYVHSNTADKENSAGARRNPTTTSARPTLGLAIQTAGGGQMDIFGGEGVSNGRIIKKQKCKSRVSA